jgi:DNA-binding HxlR family transcriptional regulator
MALGTEYLAQDCPIARTLEIVGERWTLLIVRGLAYGLRRYTDLRKDLGVSPAILTQRLNRLIEEDVVARVAGSGAHDEYELTAKGEKLWPVLYALAQWGNEFYMEPERRRMFTHHQCGTTLDPNGVCAQCQTVPAARDTVIQPRPAEIEDTSARMREPHRMLVPIRH